MGDSLGLRLLFVVEELAVDGVLLLKARAERRKDLSQSVGALRVGVCAPLRDVLRRTESVCGEEYEGLSGDPSEEALPLFAAAEC